MTRGKLYFIEKGNLVYRTVEFNGNMYPEGHGTEIILAYQNGLLKDSELFKKYIMQFDERKFHYAEETGKNLVEMFAKGTNTVLDFTTNWTDYLYVVNESGENYTILTKEGEETLQSGQMAIVRFQKLETLIDRRKDWLDKPGNQIMEITVEELLAHLEDDDFFLRYGNPTQFEYKGKKYGLMAIELYERLIGNKITA